MKSTCKKWVVACISLLMIYTNNLVADEATPANYAQVNSLLDQYTSDFDTPVSVASTSAFNALCSQADAYTPALMLLFKQNTNDRYRYAILNVLDKTHVSQAVIIPFLVDQLNKMPDPYREEGWVMRARELLVKNSPDSAMTFARKWLASRSGELQIIALDTFREIGKDEDVLLINNYMNSRPIDERTSANAFNKASNDAKLAIAQRHR